MYGPKWPFLLKYGSRDTRGIDFSQVDGLSTDTPVLGRHTLRFYCPCHAFPHYDSLWGVCKDHAP